MKSPLQSTCFQSSCANGWPPLTLTVLLLLQSGDMISRKLCLQQGAPGKCLPCRCTGRSQLKIPRESCAMVARSGAIVSRSCLLILTGLSQPLKFRPCSTALVLSACQISCDLSIQCFEGCKEQAPQKKNTESRLAPSCRFRSSSNVAPQLGLNVEGPPVLNLGSSKKGPREKGSAPNLATCLSECSTTLSR